MKQDYIAKLNANKLDEKIHEKQNEIISKLTKLSKSNNFKQYKMDIIPINKIWSWSFEFSEEELELANELVSTLFELRKGDFIAPVYNIKIKESITSTFNDFDDDIPF